MDAGVSSRATALRYLSLGLTALLVADRAEPRCRDGARGAPARHGRRDDLHRDDSPDPCVRRGRATSLPRSRATYRDLL